MFGVYAIISEKNDRIYIGQTNNLNNRLYQHNAGHCKSTCKDVPWRLYAYEIHNTRSDARWCEYQLKRSRGRRVKWIEAHKI
jgi:putative endonuclease